MFFARGISLGQKWWPIILGREISCNQFEGWNIHSSCLTFFHFKFWEGKDFFHFFLVPNVFSLCPLQVPNVFHKMFSITPHFCPICFGKCCLLFNYTCGPKRRNYILQNKTFYFGELVFFFLMMGQSNWLIVINKISTRKSDFSNDSSWLTGPFLLIYMSILTKGPKHVFLTNQLDYNDLFDQYI